MENLGSQDLTGEKTYVGAGARSAQTVLTALVGMLLSSLIAWLFYRSWLAVALFLPLSVAFVRYGKTVQRKRRQRELRRRFLDFLSSMESAIEAGEAPEGALSSSLRDLSLIYSAKDFFVSELTEMVRKLYMNRSLEDVISDFAGYSGDEDIQRFAEVFAITKRSGGDLLRVIRSAERTMAEKEDVIREIQTIITGKRLEAGIMALMPPGIIIYFLLMDRSFLMPLYSGMAGRILMSAMLLAYTGCIVLMLRITDIKV